MTGKLHAMLRLGLVGLLLLLGGASWAQTPSKADLDKMQKQLDDQAKQLKAQQKLLQDQQKLLEDQQKKLEDMRRDSTEKIDKLATDSERITKRVDVIAEEKGIEPKPNDLRAYWKRGPVLETRDKKFKVKFGGRIMWDFFTIGQDKDHRAAFGDISDGTEFRRIRFYMAGKLYGHTEYKLQVDFSNSAIALKDAYLKWKLPWSYVQAGHFYERFGLEALTSSKYTTFMERSIVTEAFVPGRNAGVAFGSDAFDKRMTWVVGAFKTVGGGGMALADSGYGFTGRVTGLPWYADKGKKLLHLGVAASYRNPEGTVRFRSRPEMHLSSSRFVDTTSFAANDWFLVGAEAALVLGPFSLQGEYMTVNVDAASDATFYGYYVQASYFLTGEHRPYSKSNASFGRVKPKHNLGKDGWGAWEIAARYSHVDLNDHGIMGGELDDITVGLNWYLNPHTRIMFNYVMADVDGVGDADMFGVRFQVDF